MSKLITLRGNSGSGKTTIAKLLQKHFGENTMLISQDVIRREILKVPDGETTKAIPLMQELVKYGKLHSDIVIVEGIMYADWYKPLFTLCSQLFNPQIYSYYFDISFEETLKRHQSKPNRNDFGEEEMRSWWREKDYSDVLIERTITNKTSIDETFKMIIDDIAQN